MPPPPSPPPLPSLNAERASLFPWWEFLRRNRHVTVPALAVPAAFAAAGEAVALTAGATWPTAVGAGVLGASVWWAAPHKWTGKDGKPRWPEVWYARLSALAAGGWLAAAAHWGLDAWTLGFLGIGAVAWGIPWWWHKRPRRRPEQIAAQWNSWWTFYASAWNLAGSHVLAITTAGVIDTLTIQLWAGRQTLKDVIAALPLVESALQGHVELGMTRAEAVRGNPSQVLVHLKRANPHAHEYTWDPALAPATITGDMPLGKNETGEWDTAPCMALNWFIIGALGGGKSNQESVMLASITGCPDALVWLIDQKGGKAARPWLGTIDWVATTVEEARLMLRTLLAEVRARALHGYDGNEELQPSVRVPAIFLMIDEAHNIISEMSGDKECQHLTAAIASECRSSAIRVIITTQYGALHESVGTEQIRGNLKNRICFRVAEANHGSFALDDWKSLDASRLENPGEMYYRLEQARSSAPSRAPHMAHPLIREIATRNARIERLPLVLYAGDHQAVYDARHARLPAVFRPGGPPAAVAAPEVPMPAPPIPLPDTPETLAQRIEDEVASIPDLATPPPVDPALLTDAVTRNKARWAQLLTQAPAGGIRPKDLNAGSGMSNSWTHQQLAALTGLGVVTKPGSGRYLPVPGQDVWAGLEKIRTGADLLAEQARTMAGA